MDDIFSPFPFMISRTYPSMVTLVVLSFREILNTTVWFSFNTIWFFPGSLPSSSEKLPRSDALSSLSKLDISTKTIFSLGFSAALISFWACSLSTTSTELFSFAAFFKSSAKAATFSKSSATVDVSVSNVTSPHIPLILLLMVIVLVSLVSVSVTTTVVSPSAATVFVATSFFASPITIFVGTPSPRFACILSPSLKSPI